MSQQGCLWLVYRSCDRKVGVIIEWKEYYSDYLTCLDPFRLGLSHLNQGTGTENNLYDVVNFDVV